MVAPESQAFCISKLSAGGAASLFAPAHKVLVVLLLFGLSWVPAFWSRPHSNPAASLSQKWPPLNQGVPRPSAPLLVLWAAGGGEGTLSAIHEVQVPAPCCCHRHWCLWFHAAVGPFLCWWLASCCYC